MKRLKKTGKYLLVLPGLILFYLFCTFVFSSVPYNTGFTEETHEPIIIFLHTNGVHTDIITPTYNSITNWRSFIPETPEQAAYTSFGWGDKGFYLNTPTWDDLTASTALRAAFWMSTTAMHVSWYNQAPAISENTVKICISKEEYRKLCSYIQQSFQKNPDQSLIRIPHDPRYYDGYFYDANGTYSVFTSCNSWVNKGLKVSGLRTCLWTPFDWPLLNAYK